MLERTLVYVDTSYLLASFYNSWEHGARGQLEIDLREVVHVLDRMICQQLDQPVQRQFWYDGIPESGPHRYQRSLRTIDGVQLRAGQLIEWGDRRTQKAVDTRLVADMVVAGMRGQVSDMVLVSGDADMLPGVAEVSNAGVRVHLYGFGWDSMSSALRHACDSTTILDPREDFAEAMQLNVLEGPLPPVVHGKPLGDVEPIEEPGATEVPDTRVPVPGQSLSDGSKPGSPDAPDDAEGGATPTATANSPREIELEAAAKAGATEVPAQAEHAAAERAESGGAAQQTQQVQQVPQAAQAQQAQQAQQAAPGVPAPTAPSVPAAPASPVPPMPGPLPGPAKNPADQAGSKDGAAADAKDGGKGAATGETPADCDDPAKKSAGSDQSAPPKPGPAPRPNPSMMAPRRKLRSRYVPLPNEVWASAGFQTPFDVGQQYANWWYEQAATDDQRDGAHLLSGGGLPPEIDRPLLQFACETLHEYTLTEDQRVNLRDGFHAGIRGVLLNRREGGNGKPAL